MKKIIICILSIILILIFINSNYIITNLIDYTNLFINNLFFYTFIIYIISSLFIDYDLLSIIKPTTYITIMSMISGFPSGAKLIKEALDKEYIDNNTANYLITYTHFPNPLFIIGSISKIISKEYSLIILFTIYISNYITSRFFKIKSNYKTNSINSNKSFSYYLNNSINNSFKTILLIYGTSICFYIISLIINRYFFINNTIRSIIFGLFDLTKGVFSTSFIHNKRISCILILLFINLSSISIHMQVKSIISNSSISYKRFLIGRIISTCISIIIIIMMHSLLDILYL